MSASISAAATILPGRRTLVPSTHDRTACREVGLSQGSKVDESMIEDLLGRLHERYWDNIIEAIEMRV